MDRPREKTTFYVGPLWGRMPEILSRGLSWPEATFVFYGGFNFFGDGIFDTIETLKKFKISKPDTRFNLCRFEEYFLILAGMLPEKSHMFRHWLNPMSGVFSAVEVYDLKTIDLFSDVEIFSEKLRACIGRKCQTEFFQNLENSVFPDVLDKLIEQGIRSKEGFQTFKVYTENGACVHEEAFPLGIVDDYVARTLARIEDF